MTTQENVKKTNRRIFSSKREHTEYRNTELRDSYMLENKQVNEVWLAPDCYLHNPLDAAVK